MLINPFPESALNDEAGKMFMEDYQAYFKKAQMMAEVHASRKGAGSSQEGSAGVDENGETDENGEPVEKRQKPVENKVAEKRRQQQKKSLKRL